MATTPQFAGTVLVGHGLTPSTNDASYTAPTHVTTIVTAGSSGTKIEEVDYVGVGTTVAGLVNLFMYDGTSYWLIDQAQITAVTPSSTQPNYFVSHIFQNLVVPSGSTLVCSTVQTGNESLVLVNAYGGSF